MAMHVQFHACIHVCLSAGVPLWVGQPGVT